MSSFTDDPQVRELLATPATVGRKAIWINSQAIRCWRMRHDRPPRSEIIQLQLRQLAETGRYRRSAPAWLPAELARWDAYLLLGEDALLGLVQMRDAAPGSFQAVSWVPRAPLAWTATTQITPDVADDAEVELSRHCVQQYRMRIRPSYSYEHAREELGQLVIRARVLPSCPIWLQDACTDGPTPYYLALGQWLALPLRRSGRPEPHSFVASTILVADRKTQDCGFSADVLLAAAENGRRIDALLGDV